MVTTKRRTCMVANDAIGASDTSGGSIGANCGTIVPLVHVGLMTLILLSNYYSVTFLLLSF